MKKILLFLFFYPTILFAQTKLYIQQYRPQFHFSPTKNWCNDPNGLVYNNGLYHLFYQYNPFSNRWGHMTWAHATSKDLITWKNLPIAIPEENGTMIFSGSCVVDKNNTSGFSKNGKIPMVAIYTGHQENINQSQYIAYSLDDGISWKKYSNNPVLDLHKKDFRDPKVFWYNSKKYWVMCVMFPVEHEVKFYSSKNLKKWKLLSSFGNVGDTSGVWECPDLLQVPIENSNKKKWLLQISQNASMQYFVGEFDGEKFINQNPSNKIFRPDYGPDYYAAITYTNLPTTNLPTAIGWVNNWNYAQEIPTTPWKSAMSLPRNLSLKKINEEWILIQKPIAKVKFLRTQKIHLTDVLQSQAINFVKGNQFEMEISIEPAATSATEIKIAFGNNNYFEIGYNAATQLFYIDRSQAGNNNFDKKFNALNRFEKLIALQNKKLQLHIYFDKSIVEVFVNNGEAVFTTQIFPYQNQSSIELFSNSSKTIFSNINLWPMKSIWQQ